jgi:hypothetical protein
VVLIDLVDKKCITIIHIYKKVSDTFFMVNIYMDNILFK